MEAKNKKIVDGHAKGSKRILMIGAYKPQIDGVSHVVQNLVKILKTTHKLYVINMEDVRRPVGLGHWKDGSIDVYQEKMWYSKKFKLIQTLFQTTKRAWLLRKKVDIYHTHAPFYSGIGLLDKKKPLVLTMHGYSTLETVAFGRIKPDSLGFRFIRWMERKAVARADAVTVVGRAIKDWAIRELHADPEKVFFVPNGVDANLFKKSTDLKKEKIISHKKITPQSKIVTYAKGIIEVNGIRTLIKSVPLVVDEYPEVVFLILGDGPLKNEMKELTKKLGVNENVIFYGPVKNELIPKILGVSDVYCVPFHPLNPDAVFGVGDTLGIAHLEAMAASLPTIGTKKGIAEGAFEKELDGSIIVTGFGDEKGVANAIKYLLSNPTDAVEIGRKARQYVMNNYRWENIAEKYLKVYEFAMQHSKK